MANKQNDLISFPMHLPREVERMFDEMIHRPWGLAGRCAVGIPPSISTKPPTHTFSKPTSGRQLRRLQGRDREQ